MHGASPSPCTPYEEGSGKRKEESVTCILHGWVSGEKWVGSIPMSGGGMVGTARPSIGARSVALSLLVRIPYRLQHTAFSLQVLSRAVAGRE